MYITAQGPHLRNGLYCVEWDVKLLLYHTISSIVVRQRNGTELSLRKFADHFTHNSFSASFSGSAYFNCVTSGTNVPLHQF